MNKQTLNKLIRNGIDSEDIDDINTEFGASFKEERQPKEEH